MKKTALAIVITALLCTNTFVYQIIATDDAMYVFHGSTFKKDSHGYQVIYEVDEQRKTLTVIKEKDVNSGEAYCSNATCEIISNPRGGRWFSNLF